ncbi:MAG: N-acetyltransferase [Bacteroidales bacterium]|jgi:predicted GNAT family acetyltransferase|nr:N-acetyltransferase [Bacteroidales bacterium]
MEGYKLIDNKAKSRYEFKVGEYVPCIEYITSNDNEIFLTHTLVPAPLRGQGIGTQLVKETLENIKEKGMNLTPLCGFVIAYIQRYPEWKKIVKQP